MLSKLIVSGATRDEALERSEKALREYSVTGLKTTLLFHRWLITQPRFRTECVDIGFVEREFTNPEESLRAIRAGDIKDPAHVPPLAGVERLEHFRFHDPERDLNYTIELLHHRDGYFVARPMLNGVVAQNEYCRRSNGRETALRAVIEILRGEIDFP